VVQTLPDVLLATSLASLDAIEHRPLWEAFATINDQSSALVTLLLLYSRYRS